MKTRYAVLIMLVLIGLSILISKSIYESDLPMWVKLWLLY